MSEQQTMTGQPAPGEQPTLGEQPARTDHPPEAGSAQGRACYVYGIVPADTGQARVERLRGIADADGGRGVSLVRRAALAAVVSEVDTGRPFGTPDDLKAHAEVLDNLAAALQPVLPFRFGTVLRDRQAVAEALLDEYGDRLAEGLAELQGKAQFTLKGRYDLDVVLREVLTERPEAQRLRDELSGLPEEAGYYQRVRLGELVSESIAAKRWADAEEVERRLAPLAVAASAGEPAAAEGQADVAFLVEHSRRGAFERAADDLARRWHGRARLRLLGPLAPYDFVPRDLGELEVRDEPWG